MSGPEQGRDDAPVTAPQGDETVVIRLLPPISGDHHLVEAPPQRVTVLEDRAQVRRVGELMLHAGQHRLVIMGVAPVAYDVSVRGEIMSGDARVIDASVSRAVRIFDRDHDGVARELARELRALETRARRVGDQQERLEERSERIDAMLAAAVAETPVDAAWGLLDPDRWSADFESIFERRREVRAGFLETQWQAGKLVKEIEHHERRRRAALVPERELVAWVELQIEVAQGGSIGLAVEYMVPNALWRPRYRAALGQPGEAVGTLALIAEAAVWQRTGEDWVDVELVCSTARSSLGVRPPALREDRLDVERKAPDVVVAAREVEVQSASVDGGAAPPARVELPGVDDGGDIQLLRAPQPVTIESTGRPAFIELFEVRAEAETALVAMPERSEAVLRRVRAVHAGTLPLLAGPVELVTDGGSVGWTELGFVSPGERFELGFGPSADVRLVRHQRVVRDQVDEVDRWRRRQHSIDLFASNLSGEERQILIRERIPVSEIEHVRVRLLGPDDGDSLPENVPVGDEWPVDENGFCERTLILAGHGRARLRLVWELATAPDVDLAS